MANTLSYYFCILIKFGGQLVLLIKTIIKLTNFHLKFKIKLNYCLFKFSSTMVLKCTFEQRKWSANFYSFKCL